MGKMSIICCQLLLCECHFWLIGCMQDIAACINTISSISNREYAYAEYLNGESLLFICRI